MYMLIGHFSILFSLYFAGENGEVSYSIVDGDLDDYFRIDENTGAIYTKADLDREVVSSYTLIVMATDKAVEIDDRRSATTEVFIS